jgi:serine/threonine protein kinase
MKKMRFQRTLGARAMAKIHKESIILERLTPSLRVLDIYSYCGYTVLVEAMASEMNDQIVPPKGYMPQSKLDELQVDDVHPLNNFTASEKLQIALDMAESLADIHGFEGGLILHTDVHLDQWLLAPDGSVKLNDFGDAYEAPWNQKSEEYCFDKEKSGSGTWRSPEEYHGDLQDEAMDVYVFGNSIYTLVSELQIYRIVECSYLRFVS